MANIERGSRVSERVEFLEVGEKPTTCTHCGARTGLIGMHKSGAREESCNHCWQRYLVTDAPEEPAAGDDPLVHGGDAGDIEVIDTRTGAVLGMTGPGLDDLLAELTPEACQADLNHLFGIVPEGSDHPDFGSF